jgi:hypothetical protein
LVDLLATKQNLLVVVDAVNMLETNWFGPEKTSFFVRSLMEIFTTSTTLVFGLHLDCISAENKLLQRLEYYSTASVHVNYRQVGTLSTRVVLRPPVKSMKFLHAADVENFIVSLEGNLKFVKDSNTAQISQVALDPTANLTFNLKLTDDQKRAKDSVVLPYMHKQEEFAKTSATQAAIPADFDDFDDDEEDPDYDLEI